VSDADRIFELEKRLAVVEGEVVRMIGVCVGMHTILSQTMVAAALSEKEQEAALGESDE
jgi:hypothetical protein